MRTDPRKACANDEERVSWALLHDFVCHPLMALTLWSAWSVRFHDWSSARAWPVGRPVSIADLRWTCGFVKDVQKMGGMNMTITMCYDYHQKGREFHIRHPHISHVLILQADSLDEAFREATLHFDSIPK